MLGIIKESHLQEAAGYLHLDEPWQWESRSHPREALAVVTFVLAAMWDHGYGAEDITAVRRALRRAILYAVKYGSRGDPTKLIRVRYHVNAERVLAEVEDEGPGFTAEGASDPGGAAECRPPAGDGLRLLERLMTWVRFNEAGNCVALCRYRGGAP